MWFLQVRAKQAPAWSRRWWGYSAAASRRPWLRALRGTPSTNTPGPTRWWRISRQDMLLLYWVSEL